MVTRELTFDERAVLNFLLAEPFPGRDQLLDQLVSVRVTGLSCGCGCPSIGLKVDESSTRASTLGPIDAQGRDAAGNIVLVGLLLHDGYMTELDFTDIAAMSTSGAVGLPVLDTLRLL
jgi:hypothetical protein